MIGIILMLWTILGLIFYICQLFNIKEDEINYFRIIITLFLSGPLVWFISIPFLFSLFFSWLFDKEKIK